MEVLEISVFYQASSRAGHLRAHLKTYSGEKSNKCNQCDYATSQTGNLRTHLKHKCFSHTCVVNSTYNPRTTCVVFTTHVCSFTHMCGNNHTYVEIAHRQVLGFYHTCVVKHTHRLISPWANGGVWLVCASLVIVKPSKIISNLLVGASLSKIGLCLTLHDFQLLPFVGSIWWLVVTSYKRIQICCLHSIFQLR